MVILKIADFVKKANIMAEVAKIVIQFTNLISLESGHFD